MGRSAVTDVDRLKAETPPIWTANASLRPSCDKTRRREVGLSGAITRLFRLGPLQREGGCESLHQGLSRLEPPGSPVGSFPVACLPYPGLKHCGAPSRVCILGCVL